MCVYLTLITSNTSLAYISYKYKEGERKREWFVVQISRSFRIVSLMSSHYTGNDLQNVKNVNLKKKKLKTHTHMSYTYIVYLLSFLLWGLSKTGFTLKLNTLLPLPPLVAYNSLCIRDIVAHPWLEVRVPSHLVSISFSYLSIFFFLLAPPTGCACHAKLKIWIIYLLRQ